MRFVAGDPLTTAPVTWFFCAPTAKPFPTVHRFGSADWDTGRNFFSDLGDDAQKPRIYYNGRRLNRSDGTTFAGPLEYFQQGAPAPGILRRGSDGTPVGCLRAPFGIMLGGRSFGVFTAQGGIKKGGSSYTPLVPIVCSAVPHTLYATVTAATGAWAFLAGYTLTINFFFPYVWGGNNGLPSPQNFGVGVGCSGGVLTYHPVFNSSSGTPATFTWSLSPINFTQVSTIGADTVTINYHQ